MESTHVGTKEQVLSQHVCPLVTSGGVEVSGVEPTVPAYVMCEGFPSDFKVVELLVADVACHIFGGWWDKGHGRVELLS
jgi:hypothetical protein